MNDFNKNFLRLLKVKNLDDKKRVSGFINKYDIELVDKQESSQGYLNVIYKGHDFVISKDYTGQTALYVNTRNLHVDYKHFKDLDFDNIVQALDKKADRHVKITETKTERYNNLKRWKKLDIDILEYHEKDIEKLKEELKRKEKFYENTKKDIEKYDKKINELLNK